MSDRIPFELNGQAVEAAPDETIWQVAERHGVEKLKTIGDAYMAVAGAPTDHSDPAGAMARFALELPAIVAQLEGDAMQIRVGMHCGPVSAGVIGASRLAWDLWGDTVNTASRMESHGLPGRVQVSAASAQQLQEHFEVESRGVVEVKGKGSLETWFLVREYDAT